MERSSKDMERANFFVALKLISIKQHGKLLEDCIEECQMGNYSMKVIEQALPEFQEEEKPEEPLVEPIVEKQVDILNITIPHTEYVKSGYFGMSSYTIYCLKTSVIYSYGSQISMDLIQEKYIQFADVSVILIGLMPNYRILISIKVVYFLLYHPRT